MEIRRLEQPYNVSPIEEQEDSVSIKHTELHDLLTFSQSDTDRLDSAILKALRSAESKDQTSLLLELAYERCLGDDFPLRDGRTPCLKDTIDKEFPGLLEDAVKASGNSDLEPIPIRFQTVFAPILIHDLINYMGGWTVELTKTATASMEYGAKWGQLHAALDPSVREPWPRESALQVVNDLSKFRRIVSDKMRVTSILFDDVGTFINNFSSSIQNTLPLNQINHTINKDPFATSLKQQVEEEMTRIANEKPKEKLDDKYLNGETIGRWVLASDNSGRAVKIQKQDEDLSSLVFEMVAIRSLRDSFESELPTNVSVYRVKEGNESLTEKIEASSVSIKTNDFYVMESSVKRSYFDWLNKPTLEVEKFENGMRLWLRDAARMVRRGLLPISIEAFHSTSQKRHYLAMRGILNNKYSYDAGRLHDWKGTITFPNCGANGIRDVGDYLDENDIIAYTDLKSNDLEFPEGDNESTKRAKLRLNALAELALAQMLVIQSRLDKLNKVNWEDSDLVKQVASWGKLGMAAIYCGYTSKKVEEGTQWAEECGVDWNCWAKQLMFWIQENPDGYTGKLLHDFPLQELYGEGVSLTTNFPAEGYWTEDEKGFRTDGKASLGGYNWSMPIKEAERAWHLQVRALWAAEEDST